MKSTIVLIDDDHGPMDYYVEALRIRGSDVVQIDTADEAFAWVANPKSQQPALVIVDMMIPPGAKLTLEETNGGLRTGIFIARAVQKRFPTIRMVALTNHNDSEIVKDLPNGMSKHAKFDISPFGFADQIVEILK